MLNIYWFRKDLRIIDNRGLREFINNTSGEKQFLFLYIKNKNTFRYFGEKRISFLTECLEELKGELTNSGFNLQIVEGKSSDTFRKITDLHNEVSVFCNMQVEPYCTGRDNDVREVIENKGGSFNSFIDATLFEPGEIKNGNGEQYKIYTPFKNKALEVLRKQNYMNHEVDLSKLEKKNEFFLKGLKEYKPDKEYKKYKSSAFLKGGRKQGIILLKDFCQNRLDEYKSKRDYPFVNGTSLLSAHIHFGTVGIRECFRNAFSRLEKSNVDNKEDSRNEIQTWVNELLWREFYYHITFHNPRIIFESFRKEYDSVKWEYDEGKFSSWCEGKTGFPIVDAGMRQLNKEGWMHNRVRMITAMFLTKDLLIDWRLGEKYFAEKLIDLDFSSNNGGWQWSASAGADAQPYFRIFNPGMQSRKFDKDGNYIKKYLPELKSLPAEFIHEPNLMSMMEQKMYSVEIGKDYPAPIVDHKTARAEAIRRLSKMKYE